MIVETLEQEVRLNSTMYSSKAAECLRLANELQDEAGRLWSNGEEDIAMYLRHGLVPRLNNLAGKYYECQQREMDRLKGIGEE